MRAAQRKRFWRTWRHRAGVALSLVAYLLATLGLPLPVRARKETAGVPFPCQDHPCGCRTAEQCWKSCCCFTPAERLAWAKTHHVTPPAYAERPAAQEGWRTTPRRRQGKVRVTTACCASHSASAKRKQGPAKPCCSSSHAQSTQNSKTAPRLALRLSAAQCQGFAAHGISGGAVVPAPVPVTWSPGLSLIACVAPCDVPAHRLPFTPPAPPPRSLARSF